MVAAAIYPRVSISKHFIFHCYNSFRLPFVFASLSRRYSLRELRLRRVGGSYDSYAFHACSSLCVFYYLFHISQSIRRITTTTREYFFFWNDANTHHLHRIVLAFTMFQRRGTNAMHTRFCSEWNSATQNVRSSLASYTRISVGTHFFGFDMEYTYLLPGDVE